MDSIQYMGNALLMEETNPVKIHNQVYAELDRFVSKTTRDHLLGMDPGADQDCRRVRAQDPYRYAEFLPLFAIRPLYNDSIWLVSKTGTGLVRAGILISVVSYFFLGIVFFRWIRAYVSAELSFAVSVLMMLNPPLIALGRDTTSDALATLIAFSSLYLIFEKQWFAFGITVLLISIFFRTDFVVLAGPVILACWLGGKVDFWKAAVLALLAISCALTINHFAGDYGIKMLYYRNFVKCPVAPAEMVVSFTFSDYLNAFRQGITLVMSSFFLPFLLLGTISLRCMRARSLFTVSLAYVVLHFVILPNWQERWVGVFYLSMGVCSIMCLAAAIAEQEPTRSEVKQTQ
jgi:hypothetical protein